MIIIQSFTVEVYSLVFDIPSWEWRKILQLRTHCKYFIVHQIGNDMTTDSEKISGIQWVSLRTSSKIMTLILQDLGGILKWLSLLLMEDGIGLLTITFSTSSTKTWDPYTSNGNFSTKATFFFFFCSALECSGKIDSQQRID